MSKQTKILQELKSKPNQWISMPYLVSVSGTYKVGTRISDLRKLGYTIENKKDIIDGETHSFYKLIEEGKQSSMFNNYGE